MAENENKLRILHGKLYCPECQRYLYKREITTRWNGQKFCSKCGTNITGNNGHKVSKRHNPDDFQYGSFWTERRPDGTLELHGTPKDPQKGYTKVAVVYPATHALMAAAAMAAIAAWGYSSLLWQYIATLG